MRVHHIKCRAVFCPGPQKHPIEHKIWGPRHKILYVWMEEDSLRGTWPAPSPYLVFLHLPIPDFIFHLRVGILHRRDHCFNMFNIWNKYHLLQVCWLVSVLILVIIHGRFWNPTELSVYDWSVVMVVHQVYS